MADPVIDHVGQGRSRRRRHGRRRVAGDGRPRGGAARSRRHAVGATAPVGARTLGWVIGTPGGPPRRPRARQQLRQRRHQLPRVVTDRREPSPFRVLAGFLESRLALEAGPVRDLLCRRSLWRRWKAPTRGLAGLGEPSLPASGHGTRFGTRPGWDNRPSVGPHSPLGIDSFRGTARVPPWTPRAVRIAFLVRPGRAGHW